MLCEDPRWYVIRTKQFKERLVKQQALTFVHDIYLPLFRSKSLRLGKLISRTEPLFPCYVFARFSFSKAYYRLKHTVGVADVVSAGSDPCEVDGSMVEEIKCRETNGLIVLREPLLEPRQRVAIIRGPLTGIEAVFERYLSGAERVAVLLESLGCGNLRATLSAGAITAANCRRVG